VQFSKYNFEFADTAMQVALFEIYEKEATRLIEANLVLPAYDYVLKCSHTFNILDARRAIAISQRQHYLTRIRQLARQCAIGYLVMRKGMGYPLLTPTP
jgi:glycyl-tRNA synthetase alpha chain